MTEQATYLVRDEAGFLLPGTKVEWYRWNSGDYKEGKIIKGFHGLYGITYLCRARGWSSKFSTQVLEDQFTSINGEIQ